MVVNEIVFDVWTNNYIMVYARKGEINARSITAAFQTEQGNYLDLTGKSVTFYACKPDGTKIYNSCTINTTDKTATVDLTSQMVSVAGIVNCEYQIFSGNTLLLKVNGLKIVVEDGGDFSEAIESSSEYNTLISAINEAESFSTSMGSIDNLNTNNKSNIVAAINEVNTKTIPITQGGTGATTATQARANLDLMHGISLWGNSSGTQSTITLSDTYTNYDFICVHGLDNGVATSTIFRTALSSQANVCNWYADSGTNSSVTGMYYHGCILKFNGTSATFSRNGVYWAKMSSSVSDTWNSNSGIYITKIVGYKY